MNKIAGNELKVGMVIMHQDQLWVCTESMAVKPGKGGAYNQVILKNVLDNRKLNERFRASESVERVVLRQEPFQFLYEQGEMLVFMNKENYDQVELHRDFVGEDRMPFLTEGLEVEIESYEEKPISVHLPEKVVVEIAEADPVIRGQTISNSFKSAILANGKKIQVPPFIEAGEKVIVSTETGDYVRRANEK